MFLIGGVLPIIWFVLSRGFRLVREIDVDVEEDEWSGYKKDWADQKDPTLLG